MGAKQSWQLKSNETLPHQIETVDNYKTNPYKGFEANYDLVDLTAQRFHNHNIQVVLTKT